jgi:pyridoxamine 5'-phosphate oxidase
MVLDQSLPGQLPEEPVSLLAAWLKEATARRDQPNPNAMVLATCDSRSHPSARIVLCKSIDIATGTVRFVSNYSSHKGQELDANPHAALVMHWDHLHRQARIEGVVQKVSAADSDAYFATRARESQLGAHASAQSMPIASREALRAQLEAVKKRFPDNTTINRPEHWGGYVLWADAVELWAEGSARLHDRARWQRKLVVTGNSAPEASAWTSTRLQP